MKRDAPERACVGIQGELTVFAVHALKDRLLAALQDSSAIDLDLSEVGEVDGAGIQLLLATHHEAQARGADLRLLAPPAAVTAALGLIGLGGRFHIEPALAAGEHSA